MHRWNFTPLLDDDGGGAGGGTEPTAPEETPTMTLETALKDEAVKSEYDQAIEAALTEAKEKWVVRLKQRFV